MSGNKDILFDKELEYSSSNDNYQVQLKRRRRHNWWWLLLLLLPLLLLLRCERTIVVTTLDIETGLPIEGAAVNFSQDMHYLLKDGHFIHEALTERSDTTDDQGHAELTNVPQTLFSLIFYRDEILIQASHPCYDSTACVPSSRMARDITIEMTPLKEDVTFTVIDDETLDPLPDATVTITQGEATDSLVTDAAGRVTFSSIRRCSDLDRVHATAYGYSDTTLTDIPVARVANPDSAILRLRPVKAGFTFFVKDVETRQPIPGATATVTLTDPRSGARGSRRATTNVDGQGRGFYDEGFILSKIDIHASKQHYNDSTLQGDYTIEQFITLPDDDRTVWLRPLPLTVQFENIDSLTHEPIPGVENIITVTDPAGNTTTFTEISNRNGIFPVSAKVGSKIVIISRKPGDYYEKRTEIQPFDGTGQKIEMTPIITPLDVDLVMVIDHTGSMGGTINMVKRHATSLYQDLNRECKKHKLYINRLRVKVVSYGDLADSRFNISPLYELPSQAAAYSSFVNTIVANGGGDEPENGLEALKEALSTPWTSGGSGETRHVVVVYTDASTHPVSPAEFNALQSRWMSMDSKARRMVLFAPAKQSWTTIASWPQVELETSSLSVVLAGTGYNKVLENICKSL